jgi:hypothetical protein
MFQLSVPRMVGLSRIATNVMLGTGALAWSVALQGFGRVAGEADGPPVSFVPEQPRVASVRDNVVGKLGCCDDAHLFAQRATSIFGPGPELLAGAAPLGRVVQPSPFRGLVAAFVSSVGHKDARALARPQRE